jgi:hypothetical protein
MPLAQLLGRVDALLNEKAMFFSGYASHFGVELAKALQRQQEQALVAHQWGELLAVKTHLLSAEEWSELFREAGFVEVGYERVIDSSPSPDEYNGRWFRDVAQLKAFKAEGALLVHGEKQ